MPHHDHHRTGPDDAGRYAPLVAAGKIRFRARDDQRHPLHPIDGGPEPIDALRELRDDSDVIELAEQRPASLRAGHSGTVPLAEVLAEYELNEDE